MAHVTILSRFVIIYSDQAKQKRLTLFLFSLELSWEDRIMLSDRIITALDTLDVTISDVARAGGCTPSNLNRIKNGVRTPPPTSPTIYSLTTGLIETARMRHLSGELIGLCGAKLTDSADAVRARLITWLYEDEPPYVRPYQKHKDNGSDQNQLTLSLSTEFSKRLDLIMKLAGVSNRRLARDSGLDPSYVSRLRRGERIPRYYSPYLERICTSLLKRIAISENIPELSELTSLPESELTGEDGAEGLRRWLFGYGMVTGYLAADELMETVTSIDKMAEIAHMELPHDFDAENVMKELGENDSGTKCGDDYRYTGIGGIRSAVTRFLTEFIQDGERELHLYSDQSMDWMKGEYQPVLTALMTELLRHDVEIHIIHTVDRSMKELVTAIKWWMPLYLSGKITSYYCQQSAGKRFSHTLFIRPGKACIVGTSVIGLEKSAVYHYSPDAEMTGLAEESFASMLKESLPLVQIGRWDRESSDSDGFVQTGKVMVKAGSDQVVIRRTEAPFLTFTFTHPMIIRAFKAYFI